MKAFKKWFNTSNRFDVRGCEAGWRAALEWVKEHHVELGIEDWTIVKQELEGTDGP